MKKRKHNAIGGARLARKRDTKKFRVGDWVLVSSLDILGRMPVYNRPPKIKYLKVKSIDSKSGDVVFDLGATKRGR